MVLSRGLNGGHLDGNSGPGILREIVHSGQWYYTQQKIALNSSNYR